MQLHNHALIGAAAQIPVPDPSPTTTYSPVVLSVPSRPVPLELHVTFPASGSSRLPVLLLSHGHGQSNYLSSLLGYTPLSSFYASHGFCVIQPTHLSSRTLSLESQPGNELWWKTRAQDMSHVIDRLNEIGASVPGLKGRLDDKKIVVAGHSLGAITASMLLGMTNTDPRDDIVTTSCDSRIKAGVILGGPGKGGSDLVPSAKQLIPMYGPGFDTMTAPALIVYGDEDLSSHFTHRDADWHADAYRLAPAPKNLFTVKGGKHGLGGISGWDAKETLDESPEMLGAVQRVTWAYLWSQVSPESGAWEGAMKAVQSLAQIGTIEGK